MTTADPRPPFGFLPWLLASLALHALVLVQWPQAGAPADTVADQAGAAPLHVQLVRPAAAAPATAAQPVRAMPARVSATRSVSVQSRIAAATRSGAAAPAAQPHKAPASGLRVARDTVQTATATGTAGSAAPGTAAPDSAGGRTQSAATTAGWSELMTLLHAAIDRHKRYPQSALSMGREGSTRVDFRLRPDGHIEDLNIGVSSGVRALDQAAYHAVQAIAPFTHADRYLDSTQRFQVDVVFRLN